MVGCHHSSITAVIVVVVSALLESITTAIAKSELVKDKVSRDRVDGSTQYIYAESEGYVVDVYDNYIILNGRDFIDNDNDGSIIPIATYKIDTTLQIVEANTFTDSTGIIK